MSLAPTKIAIFDRHEFEVPYFQQALNGAAEGSSIELTWIPVKLNAQTASLAHGAQVVCIFVNDKADRAALEILSRGGTKLLALRSAGFNHVDLAAAKELGIRVVRVPEYSPYAVAEHAVALLMTLNRKTHRAFHRVRDGNFSLDGLVGFDLHQKKVGVIGTGKIGRVLIQIMRGFGAQVLAYDVRPHEQAVELGAKYVDLETLLSQSQIISLHVPLTPTTRHMMNAAAFSKMQKGAILINTGRGALVDTQALIQALKSNHLGGAALDVYEEEEGIFFQDHSGEVLQDDQLTRLLSFPNVILTSHQAFLTQEALGAIAGTTIQNVLEWKSNHQSGSPLSNEVQVS